MLEIRWHGRGGQGAFTAAKVLGASASLYENKFALAFPSFGPERRGAPIQAFTKIDDKKIIDRSEIKQCDYIIFLDETLFNPEVQADLKPGGKIVVNSAHPEYYRPYGEVIRTVDADGLARRILKRPITNTAMLGALVGVSGIISLGSVLSGTGSYFSGGLLEKNREVIQQACLAAKEAVQ